MLQNHLYSPLVSAKMTYLLWKKMTKASIFQKYADNPVIFYRIIKLSIECSQFYQLLFIYHVTQRHMMKNNIVIGIVVAMALGVVITCSTLTVVSAQQNLTSGGENTTAGGGNIVRQLKSAAVKAELIDNKKMFIIACEPSMTDPDTQCVVANLEMR